MMPMTGRFMLMLRVSSLTRKHSIQTLSRLPPELVIFAREIHLSQRHAT
jgi:hypothetical protein